MGVTKTSLSGGSPIFNSVSDWFEIDQASRTLIVHLGRELDCEDSRFTRCWEEIVRLRNRGDFEEMIFDLAGLLVLPSSALGMIAAASQGETKVRVINASLPAREDFQLTGLESMIDLEPAPAPPRK